MWACYKVYLEAKAPIHIGYGAKLGIVDRTRYYIPAKNVWGALTNLIVKSVMENYNPEIYQEVGESLNKNIKFSYFYPTKYEKANEEIKILQVFAPCYTEEGLKFGVHKDKEKISLERFERVFISSFVSTAIDKTSKSAEEGSLHEIEFIRDKIESETGIKPTVFVGYFFVRDEPLKIKVGEKEVEISLANSIEVNGVKLNEMWVGGERNYGFGRVNVFLERFSNEEVDLFSSGMIVDTTKEQLTIRGEEYITALSHINIENLGVKLIKGDIEPLIGREWSERGSGQKISQTARICVSPGSQFICDREISIGNFGIWEELTN